MGWPDKSMKCFGPITSGNWTSLFSGCPDVNWDDIPSGAGAVRGVTLRNVGSVGIGAALTVEIPTAAMLLQTPGGNPVAAL